jgi:hypothetical protein
MSNKTVVHNATQLEANTTTLGNQALTFLINNTALHTISVWARDWKGGSVTLKDGSGTVVYNGNGSNQSSTRTLTAGTGTWTITGSPVGLHVTVTDLSVLG